MMSRRALLAGGLLTGLLVSHAALDTTTTITFEEVPVGTTVTQQYGARGVSFHSAYVDSDANAHSGNRVLLVEDRANEFNVGPLVIDFASGQRTVSFYAGIGGPQALSATLRAFDAAGTQVASQTLTVTPGAFTTRMEVATTQPVIRRVELLYSPDTFEAIDDLAFSGDPPVGVPTTPPVVTITSPTPNQAVDASSLRVQGTVAGEGLTSPAWVHVEVPRPVGSSTTSVYTYPFNLPASGNPRPFDQAAPLGVGLQTITVEAENTGGLRGRTSVVVEALPAVLRARVATETSLGAFLFGSPEATPACTYAVYQNGAVAAVNGQAYAVRGALFAKWLSLKDPGLFPRLGCPTGDARESIDGALAQDFAGGRLYATASAAFFVPPVFASAIDALGGDAGVGLPIADPTSDTRPAYRTWLFQQFRRTGIPLPSTLEIRGDPPRLYVQRQAGDGSAFWNVIRPNNPTISEDFACSGTSGPCAVAAPPDEPRMVTQPICGSEFDWQAAVDGVLGDNPNPPEWVAIHGHGVQTPVWGALFDVHLASGDNPLAHRNYFEPCPFPLVTDALVNERICPSDWDLKIRPLPGYRWMVAEGRNMVQVEFERLDVQAFLVAYGDPTPGELIFASGRFVADCGHGPFFKTEIHPPSVYAAVSNVTHNGRPATRADIWVNRFFPGGDGPGDVVEFNVTPPPRPSPDATLGMLSPGDQNLAVTVTFTPIAPFGPVRVRVKANRREPNVDKYGQMHPRTDDTFFGFNGRLLVFWNTPTPIPTPTPLPTPTPTPTPTPKPPLCPSGKKCCEERPDGTCAKCILNSQVCP